MGFSKQRRRRKIHNRIRNKVRGTVARPRLCVYRSNKEIYCQAVDDVAGTTILSASSMDESVQKNLTKTEQAKEVGKVFAEKALANNITTVVFDRGGHLYHGRVKALAEGAREAGLQF